jgi:PAS domain-containing protein
MSTMRTLAPQRLSDLIGRIYDCAIEPDWWPNTLAEIGRAIHCVSGTILLIDLERSRYRFAYTWGVSPQWVKRYLDYSADLTEFCRNVFHRRICPDGEPLVLSQYIDAIGPRAQRIYSELTQEECISEMVQTVVLRETRRLAVVGVNRHESVGDIRENELAIIRLLVPHIQRAVKIIDILDVKKIEAHTLSATLDNLTTGVVVVADRGRILHANAAARRMLSAHAPIAAVNGVLSTRDAKANRELADAVAKARVTKQRSGRPGSASRCAAPTVRRRSPMCYPWPGAICGHGSCRRRPQPFS